MTKVDRTIETGTLVACGYRVYACKDAQGNTRLVWATSEKDLERVTLQPYYRIEIANGFQIDESHVIILPEDDGGYLVEGEMKNV